MANLLFQVCEGLSRAGILNKVFTLGMKGAPRSWRPFSGTTVFAVRAPWLPFRSAFSGTVGIVASWAVGTLVVSLLLRRSLRREVDVVHVHFDDTVWPPLVAIAIRALLKKPLMITVHCAKLTTFEPPHRLSAWVRGLTLRIEIAALRLANRTQFLTNRTREAYLSVGAIRLDRSFVLGDCVDCTVFTRASAEEVDFFRTRLGIPKASQIILFAGRISWEKGWEHFVEAANYLRERSNLHFLVSSGGLQHKRMEKLIGELGLKERFTVTGYLPHSEMPVALSSGDVFVFPSNFEEFGYALLEAMAVESPIVATSVGGIPEVVGEGEAAILVPPSSPDLLAKAIEEILDNRELARDLGARARERTVANFNLQTHLEHYVSQYRALLIEARGT